MDGHGVSSGCGLRSGIFQAFPDNAAGKLRPSELLTAEEFLVLPEPGDGSVQELVRGEIVTLARPGGLHGVTCSKVDRKIGGFVDDGIRGNNGVIGRMRIRKSGGFVRGGTETMVTVVN